MSLSHVRQTLCVGVLLLTALPAWSASPSVLLGESDQALATADSCLSDEQRDAIRKDLAAHVADLRARDRLSTTTTAIPSLGLPLQAAPGYSDFGFYMLAQNVHQTNYAGLTDYNCGSRTYSKHRGTDFGLTPLSWTLMDSTVAQIVAADAGTIINKTDGNYDRVCAMDGTSQWNAVYLQHADGSQTWYGHMKNGSVTAKGIGDTVAKGEYLGLVGSSGNSSGPHLHFEVYNAQGALVDPYSGSCNAMNTQSWWTAQRPYYESALLKVATHSAPPVSTNCGFDVPNFKDTFQRGDPIVFVAYFRDLLVGHTTQWSVVRTDGTTWWTMTLTNTSYSPGSAATRWMNSTIGASDPLGTNWQFRITYLGTTYTHRFTVSLGGVSIPDAVDAPALTWTTGGSTEWYGQTNTTHDGVDAAQSGAITHNQTNWVETKIVGPGYLSYVWKVSSETNSDYLRFYYNGFEQAGSISGNTAWDWQGWDVPSGTQTVRWAYTKNGSTSSSSDCGWLDQLSFVYADLQPYQPANWSAPLVVSTVPGTTIDAAQIGATNTLYLDWSVANYSEANIITPFRIGVYIDGQMRFTNNVTSLDSYTYSYWTDTVLSALSPGLHTLQLVADTTGTIPETSELNNSYTRTINVQSASSPGALQFTAGTYDVLESSSAVTAWVARVGGNAGAASVTFTTLAVTATAGLDYVATNGTVTWADGDGANKGIVIRILNDTAYEGIEYLDVLLKGAVGAATGSLFATTITITDDEPAPIVPIAHYVVTNNPNAQAPYTNWYTAATSIQAAVDVSVSNDIIWVTNGVYDTGAWPTNGGDVRSRILVDKTITIRSVNGPSVTIIRGTPGPNGAWTNGAVRCAYLDNAATLVGFTLTNGYQWSGGGVFCPTFRGGIVSNCVVTGNSAYWGGGVYYARVYSTLFVGNRGIAGGGARDSILRNCTLINNRAGSTDTSEDGIGGGADWSDLYDCTLISNRAGQYGGGAKGHDSPQLTICSNCYFQGNSSDMGGGAFDGYIVRSVFLENTAPTNGFYGYGGGVGSATLSDCIIVSNRAQDGGGAWDSTLANCLLEYNYAMGSGGADDSLLSNCVIRFNTAEILAGGTYGSTLYNCLLVGNVSSNRAGAAESCYLFNCTVSGNRALTNAGALRYGEAANTIVYSNYAPLNPQADGTKFTNSCMPGLSGNNNITNDPLFVSIASLNYRLLSNSPCINRGTNFAWTSGTLDLDGYVRVYGANVDLGAYEYASTNLLPPGKPNLAPVCPAGWSDRIVASAAAGTTVDSALTAGNPIYVDWAMRNVGEAAVVASCTNTLYVDGALLQSWYITGLAVNATASIQDLALAPLSPGLHTLQFVADAGQAIGESVESDNSYLRTILVVAYLDADGDSIDDNWELQFFGSLTNVNGISDWDHDGFCDHFEYHAGTVPTNNGSFLGVVHVARATSTTGTVIYWCSVAGKQYTLERSTNLVGSKAFTSVAQHIAGQAATTILTDQTENAAGLRFYRVGVEY